MAKTYIKEKEVALNGKLRTYEDAASIGPNDFVTLDNLRYTYTHPKTINGISVITSAGAPQNIGNAVHFRKGQPLESHVLVHAVSAIYDMTAAVPAAGAFGTTKWTDTAAGATARFAFVNGLLAYANGVGDTCVYGGDEFRVGAFINYTSAAMYDFTDAVNNIKTDAGNIATLKTYQASADSNTLLLLHMDGSGNDSGAGGHDFASVGVTFPNYWAGFASAAYFDGSSYLSAAAHADFNMSAGEWTLDTWITPTIGAVDPPMYYQASGAGNYFQLGLTRSGSYFSPALYVYSAASAVVSVTGASFLGGNRVHLAAVESGDNYYLFKDGILQSTYSGTGRAADYSGNVQIGYNGTRYYRGYIDEFRKSNVARWTSNFTPPTTPYGNNYVSNNYVGSIMPLAGAKLYVANSQSGKTVSIAVNEWNGSAWTALTVTPSSQVLADSTAYTLTWPSTAATSKQREINKVVQYWYQVILYNATDFNDITISKAATVIPFQQVRDFWSGEPWSLAAFLVNKSGNFNDYTANVSDDAYDSANEGSYAKLVSLSNTDYVVIGSTERLMGAVLQLVGTLINETNTTISVAYYNGTDSLDNAGAWTAVPGFVDGTLNGTKTLNKSGFVTWTPPTEGSEFKSAGWSSKAVQPRFTGWKPPVESVAIGPPKSKGEHVFPLYYYKITFAGATTSADIRISYAYGIPSQRTIRGFKFPVVHQDRLWLCGDMQGEKNYVICSAYQAPTVLGFGKDNAEFWLGDDTEMAAGASLFTRYGATVADILVLCKQHETYTIDGDGPETYKQRRVSEHIGCIAPPTMITVPMGDEAIPGVPRTFSMWLSQQGWVMFDGTNFTVVSKDIHDKFEPTNANYIGAAITTCTSYYDSTYGEAHLIVPGVAEYVYDVARKKFYTADRGSYPLRCGLTVYDTNGLAYTYGAAGAKLYRLENGSTMAGEAFNGTVRSGDMALPEGSIMEDSRVNWLMVVGKVGSNPVSASYYTDSATTPEASVTLATTNSGKRLFDRVSHDKSLHGYFHGFELSSVAPFEPMYLAFRYTVYPRELS